MSDETDYIEFPDTDRKTGDDYEDCFIGELDEDEDEVVTVTDE